MQVVCVDIVDVLSLVRHRHHAMTLGVVLVGGVQGLLRRKARPTRRVGHDANLGLRNGLQSHARRPHHLA